MEGKSLATKSKWLKPEKFFPVVVDDFFDTPEVLMEYGKSLPKEKVGNQPGKRTKQLWELDIELHNTILKKILSCYYDLDYTNLSWKLSNMSFHEIPRFHEAKSNVKNKGWIHQDNVVHSAGSGPDDEVAGLIYLTPDIDLDSGTSLWSLKPNFQYNFATQSLMGRTEEQERGDGWAAHRENFNEKLRFQNIFNRLIMYDACEFHAANSYWNGDGKDARLTLAFFIGGIEGTEFPLKRTKNYGIEKLCG